MPPSTAKALPTKGKTAQPASNSAAGTSSASNTTTGRVLSAQQLDEQLARLRTSALYVMIRYGHLYLPDADLVERYTTWGRDSIGDVVVFKDLEDAKARYASMQDTASEASSEEADDEDDRPPVDGDPVILQLVTTVDKAGSLLTADGNWQGLQNSSLPDPPKFDKLTLKIRLGAVARKFASFVPEHTSAVDNLRKLLGLRAKSEYSTGPSLEGFFHLNHRVFAKLQRSAVDGSLVRPDLAGLPSFYNINHYPFHTIHAMRDVKEISSTHRVVPLPAYENDNIINPNAYEDAIGGSLVLASFKLRHYLIKKQSVFSYELDEINIVSRGAEGTKRKAGIKSTSPMKKMRLL